MVAYGKCKYGLAPIEWLYECVRTRMCVTIARTVLMHIPMLRYIQRYDLSLLFKLPFMCLILTS